MLDISARTVVFNLALWTCIFGYVLSWSLAKNNNELLRQVKETKTKTGGVHWALVIAGSSGYYNYRHQVSVACLYI